MLASELDINEWACFTTVKVGRKNYAGLFRAFSMLSSTFKAKELTYFFSTPRFLYSNSSSATNSLDTHLRSLIN